MHPQTHAASHPEKPAIIMAGTGAVIPYAALNAASNRAAQFFRSRGFQVGDVVAICLPNHPRYFEIAWGAQRAGLYLVAISSRLTPAEIDYIVRDSGAALLITGSGIDSDFDDLTRTIETAEVMNVDEGWADALADMPDTPIADERGGADMLYSSGTTGRPKGIKAPLPDDPAIDVPNPLYMMAQMFFGLGPDSIYLSPAPLYHAAPLRWCMSVHKLGGTVIVMEKFDPEKALALIEKYRVNASQWVPTHFVRMLKLPEEVRARYDVSSLKCAIHAAAPCPVPVKQAMIEWWGPVLNEYYAGTEGNGMTAINSADWLTHPGSVGRPIYGELHICDEAGEEVPAGTEGAVFFGGTRDFAYHGDAAKTEAARNAQGWSTLGDVGRVDADGFLYLTDRKDFMIISGGVNIYPQEIENLLVTHPAVADAAVIGAPDPDMGERVVAVVQPVDIASAGPELAETLTAYLRENLSGVKVPRQIDFRAELPRHDTGKLYKRLLRDEYRGEIGGGIV